MECSEIHGYKGRKHLHCKVGGVRVLGTPGLWHRSSCTRRSSGEKTAEQAGQKGCTASAGVKTWLSNQGYTPLPEKAACGGQGREALSLCDGCTPICCAGAWGCSTRLLVCILYFLQRHSAPHSPFTTLASTICSYSVGTRVTPILPLMEGIPKTQICTELSWSHVLVSVWSYFLELEREWVQNPGCQVLASQSSRASFQPEVCSCEGWGVGAVKVR